MMNVFFYLNAQKDVDYTNFELQPVKKRCLETTIRKQNNVNKFAFTLWLALACF